MASSDNILDKNVIGNLEMADRIIFKGHLTSFFPDGAFSVFLSRQGVLLKDFKSYVKKATAQIKAYAEDIASSAKRPFKYLNAPHTARSGNSKEKMAREIAQRDGIEDGLVCVFYVLENCTSFVVRGDKRSHRLRIDRRRRKCLHFYFYYMHPEFGFMHVRLQSWFPFQIQVYINGREWLCRQLDSLGIGYQRYENALTSIDNIETAQKLCNGFFRKKWHKVLEPLARAVNPWLPKIEKLGFGSYYWCIDQCEIATDLMFKSRASLTKILPLLFTYSILAMSAEDAFRYLGRKPNGNFRGEIKSDLKKRPEGYRVKFSMKRNSIKMYDKFSVLRFETTINNPREFKIPTKKTNKDGTTPRRWMPMNKGVANFWRFKQVGAQANERFLKALAEATPQPRVVEELDRISRPRRRQGRQFARFNPVSEQDSLLFLNVLAGPHNINGFRNKDLTRLQYKRPARNQRERNRRCQRTSRLIAKLRGHGLIAKVPGARMYRVTALGHRVMYAVLRFRKSYLFDVGNCAA